MDFLAFLRDLVRQGLSAAPVGYREMHARWIAQQEHREGGFVNRRGNAELYYSTFAIRSLSALNALTPDISKRTLEFLMRLSAEPKKAFGDAVSAASWWDACTLCEEVSDSKLETSRRITLVEQTHAGLLLLRREDGGWAKTPMEGNSGLYHTLLAAATYRRMGSTIPDEPRIATLVEALTRKEGGFIENRFSKRPGTNGTAAGVALRLILEADGIPQAQADMSRHAAFVRSMHGTEGGFHATPGAPIADLLSTFTALFILELLGQRDERLCVSALAYARGLEDEAGGYCGFALESVVDCEYTFYGLGVEALAKGFQ